MISEFPDPREADNILYNPSFEELRSLSADATTTEYGSPAFVTDIKSRSADRTKNNIDDEFTDTDAEHIERAHDVLADRKLICLDRAVGRHPDASFSCRLFVPREYARIALGWGKLLEPTDEEPDFHTVQLPDWEEVRVRIFPDEGATYVLGSDYTGEAKKSFLRLFMYHVKQRGGLGLHAGSKRVQLKRNGTLESVGQLYLGLSATGKSTLTGHGFWLDDPNRAELLQDDVCALLPDGAVAGSEGNGLYIKTIGLEADEQPELYHAATQSKAVYENVTVTDDGTVDFDSDEHTSNSRSIVVRDDIPNASDDLDLDAVDQMFFITRNPLMPPAARLTPTQAAVAFMLGESIETSAGDPDRAGESIRVVGTNPFIVGSEGEEGNRFLDLVEANDVECFVINTGTLGDAKDIGVHDTVNLLRGITEGGVEWEADDLLGLQLPASIPDLDASELHPADYVNNYESELESFREERREYLKQFDDLRDDIKAAVY